MLMKKYFFMLLNKPYLTLSGTAHLPTSTQFSFHFSTRSGSASYECVPWSQISGGPISEQREWLRTMTSRSRASFSCSQRKTMEKDTREAIRSVVGSLPKIDKLKPEQEQALLSFVGGHDVVVLLPTGFGKS